MSSAFRARLTNVLKRAEQQRRRPAPKRVKEPVGNFHIVRGDTVQVLGREGQGEAGKRGVVLQVLRDARRVVVEGVNVRAHHIKGNPDRGIPGRTVQKEASLPYSRVGLIDPVSDRPTRIRHAYLEDGTKVRVAQKSGAVVPRPDVLRFRKRPVNALVCAVSDTADPNDVWEITYKPAAVGQGGGEAGLSSAESGP